MIKHAAVAIVLGVSACSADPICLAPQDSAARAGFVVEPHDLDLQAASLDARCVVFDRASADYLFDCDGDTHSVSWQTDPPIEIDLMIGDPVDVALRVEEGAPGLAGPTRAFVLRRINGDLLIVGVESDRLPEPELFAPLRVLIERDSCQSLDQGCEQRKPVGLRVVSKRFSTVTFPGYAKNIFGEDGYFIRVEEAFEPLGTADCTDSTFGRYRFVIAAGPPG